MNPELLRIRRRRTQQSDRDWGWALPWLIALTVWLFFKAATYDPSIAHPEWIIQ